MSLVHYDLKNSKLNNWKYKAVENILYGFGSQKVSRTVYLVAAPAAEIKEKLANIFSKDDTFGVITVK
jgi:hypothetical protein